MSEIKIIQDKMREFGIKGITKVKDNPKYYYALFRMLQYEHEHDQENGWLQVDHYRYFSGKTAFPFRCPACKARWVFFWTPDGYTDSRGNHECKKCGKSFPFNAAFISKDMVEEEASKARYIPNLCSCGKERGIQLWCDACTKKKENHIKYIGMNFIGCGNSLTTFTDFTHGIDPYKPFRRDDKNA